MAGQILRLDDQKLASPIEGLGLPIGNLVIELFDNGGQLMIRLNWPAGDGKGGMNPEQRDIYLAALGEAMRLCKKQGRGKLQAILGPKGDFQGPVAGRANLG